MQQRTLSFGQHVKLQNGKRTYTNYTSEKQLISKIHKELKNKNKNKNRNQDIKKTTQFKNGAHN